MNEIQKDPSVVSRNLGRRRRINKKKNRMKLPEEITIPAVSYTHLEPFRGEEGGQTDRGIHRIFLLT